MFKKPTEDDGRDGRNDEKTKNPNRFKLVVSAVQTQHPTKDGHPVAPEDTGQSHKGSDVQHCQEWQEHFRMFVQVPVKDTGQQNGMAEATDGKGLSNALNDGENDGLKKRHGACTDGRKRKSLA